MQSSNPVFNRSEGFNGRGQTTYAGNGMSYPAYGAPAEAGQWQGGGYSETRPMTIDSVVQKTGITLAVVVVVAAATWVLTPPIDSIDAARTLGSIAMLGALGGFALSLVNSFKRVVSPALVIAYAAFEGLFVGGFSKAIETQFSGPNGSGGLVIGAVVGTFGAVGGTLAAYKFFDIQVGSRFRKWAVAAMFGFVGVALLDFVLGIFHADLGLLGFGPAGLLFSILGLGIGVIMLILDFDFVERGIAAGLPERESWRAAFGLTVTIIWIYIQLLKILAILRGQD
ncbi:Bax inhibitor-1/YccA family protein [Nocardioides marmoribigeumensis]|uniref:YccA/Bax inhibitor family protein n=1 Tax=Nocardioides marmoribigeumensis TaxID=433649 RepID=A0ABU2BZK6_9ACTN|nr:Bax inhibitor-1/YccA family protein [Nocardioides marmoribigeumensis]MDR7363836.1 putative YccA/Bax inhibitor family protein [Nocardioides marmoribigeumensis]